MVFYVSHSNEHSNTNARTQVLKTSVRTRWAVLRKLYWLAPARAVTKTDLMNEEDEEKLSIPEVPIGRLDCMCKFDVMSKDGKKHSRRECRSLRNLHDKELLSTSVLVRVLKNIKAEKSILVCQLEMVCVVSSRMLEREIIIQRSNNNKQVRKEEENVFIWEEVSRGFVLCPNDWHARAHLIRTRDCSGSITTSSSEFPVIYEGQHNMETKIRYETKLDMETLLSSLKSSTISSSAIDAEMTVDFICHHALLHSEQCHKLLSLLAKKRGKNSRDISNAKKEQLRSYIEELFATSETVDIPPYRVLYRVLRYLKLSFDLSDISSESLREHLERLTSIRELRDFVDLVVLIGRQNKLMTCSLAERVMKIECTTSTECQECIDLVKRLCDTNLSNQIDSTFETSSKYKENKEQVKKMILQSCSDNEKKYMRVQDEEELRDVIFVNNEKMLRSVSLDHDVVALDCEWDPKRKTLQLIQIATSHVVYVFDVQEIMKIDQSERLTKLLSTLFQRSLIFGWCMDSDLTQICTWNFFFNLSFFLFS